MAGNRREIQDVDNHVETVDNLSDHAEQKTGAAFPGAGSSEKLKPFGEFVTFFGPTDSAPPLPSLRRIRTALQFLNAKRIYRSHSNAAAIKPGVPWQAARGV